jgi:hypothetical protein
MTAIDNHQHTAVDGCLSAIFDMLSENLDLSLASAETIVGFFEALDQAKELV